MDSENDSVEDLLEKIEDLRTKLALHRRNAEDREYDLIEDLGIKGVLLRKSQALVKELQEDPEGSYRKGYEAGMREAARLCRLQRDLIFGDSERQSGGQMMLDAMAQIIEEEIEDHQ